MGTLLLRDVRCVDPAAGATSPEPTDVLVEDGWITELRPRDAGAPPPRLPSIDGGGRFLLPGLIDCHCHLCGFYLPDMPRLADLAWIPRQVGLNLRAHLAAGVTTVRDLMAPLRIIAMLRRRARRPRSGYPKILCSGPMLTVPGGYPAFVPRDTRVGRAIAGPLRVELTSPRDARRWVDELADAGVDCIKVAFSTRAYDAAGTPLAAPSAELVRAIADRAHHRGLPIAVHHSWARDLRVLLDLPFDTLEHLTLDEDIDPELADRIAARGLPVTTNVESFAFIDKAGELLEALDDGAPLVGGARAGMRRMLRAIADRGAFNPHFDVGALSGRAVQMRRNLAALAARDVCIGAATDAGTNVLFGSLIDELEHMVAARLSPARAVRAATTDAARLLGRRELGRLEVGARADLVLCDADPLADIAALRRVALVVRDGEPVAGALANV